MPFGRNPIINSPGRVSYFTNSGQPYTEVDNPSDVRNIDPLAQPRETVFVNKDASGTRASAGSGTGIGLLVGNDGKNLLWDNTDGTFTGNTGQDIGVVKVTGQFKRHQSRKSTDMVTDIPFVQYGGTSTAIGGRRLVGSQPQLSKRKLHMTDTVVATREYRLRDPRNPFSAEVVPGSERTVHTHFQEEAVDVFVVGYPAQRYQRIPLERGFTSPRYPINTIGGTHPVTGQNLNQFQPDAIGNLPYINQSIEINTETYLKDIIIHPNFLALGITATLANDNGGTATYSVDWGDGTPVAAGIASGTAAPAKTYANTGVFTVRIINDANPTDVKEEIYFMKAPGWLPTPLAFDPAFEALALTAVAGAQAHTFAPFVVQGAPFIKLMVDFGDGAMSGSAHQNLTSFLPISQSLTESTFQLSHRYTHRGTFKMSIWAERLSDEAADGQTGLTQQRQQVLLVKTVRVD